MWINSNLKKMSIQSVQMILTTILGERTNYVHGQGYGKRPPEQSCVQQVDLQASMSSTMGSMCQEMQAEMERKLQEECEQVVAELQRKLEEERARMDIQVDKRTQVKMDAFMIRMQQQR